MVFVYCDYKLSLLSHVFSFSDEKISSILKIISQCSEFRCILAERGRKEKSSGRGGGGGGGGDFLTRDKEPGNVTVVIIWT